MAKKFLKFLFFAIIGIGILLLIILNQGCTPERAIVATQKEPTQVLNQRPPNLVVWRESIHSNIKKDDVVFFYNTYEIEVSGVLPKYEESDIKDGGFSSMDTVFYVIKTVPPYTPGRIEELTRDPDGILIKMKIKFDFDDKTYKLSYLLEDYARYLQNEEAQKKSRNTIYKVKDSGSFILDAAASLFFQGKESNVTASAKSEDEDRLLVKDTRQVIPVTVKEQAKGMKSGQSNQITPKVEKNNGVLPAYTPTK